MPNEDTACAHCRKPATKKCSGCKAVRYCSHKCQEAHWKSGHKTKCKDLRPPGVNSTARSWRKTSGLGGKSCSGIELIPAHGRGISKPIKQPKKNTASKYFEVDANFESTPPRESAVVIENSSSTSTTNNSSSTDHLHLSSPMPNKDTACAHCRNPASKKCSGCNAVRYW